MNNDYIKKKTDVNCGIDSFNPCSRRSMCARLLSGVALRVKLVGYKGVDEDEKHFVQEISHIYRTI